MTEDKDGDDLLEEFGLGGAVQSDVPSPSPSPQATPSPGGGFSSYDQLIGDSAQPQLSADVLAALRMNPAFADYATRRGDGLRPTVKPQYRASAQISLVSGNIAPGDTVTVSVVGYTTFEPTKFLASETVPGTTEIVGMFIGHRNCFPNAPGANGIPTAHFAGQLFGTGIPFPVVNAGIPITVMVKNTSKAPVQWVGTLFGPQMR